MLTLGKIEPILFQESQKRQNKMSNEEKDRGGKDARVNQEDIQNALLNNEYHTPTKN